MAGSKTKGKEKAPKKPKKDKKKDGSMPNISTGLLQSAMFTAVPTTPPPEPSPDVAQAGPASTILNSSLLRQMFATPAPLLGNSLNEREHEDGDRPSDPDTSLYDYDQDEPGYSTAGYGTSTPADQRLTLSDRPRLETPSHTMERGMIQSDLYSIPNKRNFSQTKQVGSDSELTNVSTDVSPQSSPGVSTGRRRNRSKNYKGKSPVEEVMIHPSTAAIADHGLTVPKHMYGDVPVRSADTTLQSTVTPRILELQKQNDDLLKRQQELQEQLTEQQKQQELLQSKLEPLTKKSPNRKELLQKKEDSTDQILRQQEELIRTLQDRSAALSLENSELLIVNKALQRQINSYKDSVHRLSTELSQYQAKYRSANPADDGVGTVGLPLKGPVPSWLINTKYLSPLLVAYDDKLVEQTKFIHTCEQEILEFRRQMEDVLKENERLHVRLEQASVSGPLGFTEWQQIQEQAKLVLEENQLLMEQIDVQQNKSKDMHKAHIQEVAHLTKQILILESEKGDLEEDIQELKHKLSMMKKQYDAAVVESQSRIPSHDYQSTVAELERSLHQSHMEYSVEVDGLKSQLKASRKEHKNLGSKVADLTAEIQQLNSEIRALQKLNKHARKRITMLQHTLEQSESQGLSANQYLTSVVKLAEMTAAERDTYAEAVHKEELERKKVLNRMMEGSVTMGKLEEKLQSYKEKANEKLVSAAKRLKEQDDEFNHRCQKYEREITHLRLLLEEKGNKLDAVSGEKRNLEENLETMWQAANADNQRMKYTLQQTTKNLLSRGNSKKFLNEEMDHDQLLLSSDCDS